MKALITGIAGQDGSYLAEHLLNIGYEVHGMIRRNSTPEHQESRIAHLEGKIKTYYGDVTDVLSIERLLKLVQPDEIYNLAAQSHVRISFDVPIHTKHVNEYGVTNMLIGVQRWCPKAKFYQASSSEMFGNSVSDDGFQRETTPMEPVSPYGKAKYMAYQATHDFRRSEGMYVCNGILFNHESPRRATNFVTNKIIKAAVRIKAGLQDSIDLGNLDAKRDWGHSKDYVRAMHLIMQQPEPGDYIVATGETRSVRELCEFVFTTCALGDYRNYVKVDEKNIRPNELHYLQGDASRIRALGWKPEYNFVTMIYEMIDYWRNETINHFRKVYK
jgi:GDPmannose 4,6-dehydratase